MKVVVQNGARHALSRRDVEAMIPTFPPDWERQVASIVLYQTNEDHPFASYHPKEKILGLHWPASSSSRLSKSVAIEELCVALAAVAEMGHLPPRLSGQRRADYSEQTLDVQRHCMKLVDAQPGGAADAPQAARR
jgi:hypothetical protein